MIQLIYFVQVVPLLLLVLGSFAFLPFEPLFQLNELCLELKILLLRDAESRGLSSQEFLCRTQFLREAVSLCLHFLQLAGS